MFFKKKFKKFYKIERESYAIQWNGNKHHFPFEKVDKDKNVICGICEWDSSKHACIKGDISFLCPGDWVVLQDGRFYKICDYEFKKKYVRAR